MSSLIEPPLRVGIVGTGFVAKLRAELLSLDSRVELRAIAGNLERATAIAQEFGMEAHAYWSDLVVREDIDLVVVATTNRDHGTVTLKSLGADKHVIVEYPLSLDLEEAREIVRLSRQKERLLHVEHIELLGSVHRLVVEHLDKIGEPFYARYATQTPQRPSPDKWTYYPELFGFPMVAAVSRIHRLTCLFGDVRRVSCQYRYAGEYLPQRFSSCTCNAQLHFANGLIADVGYSKGENLWKSERIMEIQGTKGAILFSGDEGKVISTDGELPLQADPAKGLFKRDTENILDRLFYGQPLYTTPESALHALTVACAAEKAAKTGQVVTL